MLFKYSILAWILLAFIACGKRPSEEENIAIKAKEALNDKNYLKANKLYQRLVNQSPHNKKYQYGLADSYLGMGGFELFEFLVNIDQIIQSSFDSNQLYFELKKFTDKYFLINDRRKVFLNHALNIYYKFSDTSSESSKEEKLKKGLVHIFLLTQNIKDLIVKIENEVSQIEVPKPHNNQDIRDEYQKFVKKFLVHIDASVFHSFKAYVNLRSSFEEVIDLLVEVDKAMERTFGKPYNRIRGDLNNLTLEKLLALFIKYNPEIYKDIMQQVLQTCDRKVALVKIMILEDIVQREYENHEYQESALKLIQETKKYLESHDATLCHNL
jgi:hypothetical protein